ncbi:MAG: hypothetical protein M3O74_28780 [Pseudomonadota bacterium]|nr:hypothetical protein [Pseudomonadota bacterium]
MSTSTVLPAAPAANRLAIAGVLPWLLCAIFYFYQYAVRSAPGVMQNELAQAWGGNHIGSIVSAYYMVYALMALVAGVQRWPRSVGQFFRFLSGTLGGHAAVFIAGSIAK